MISYRQEGENCGFLKPDGGDVRDVEWYFCFIYLFIAIFLTAWDAYYICACGLNQNYKMEHCSIIPEAKLTMSQLQVW